MCCALDGAAVTPIIIYSADELQLAPERTPVRGHIGIPLMFTSTGDHQKLDTYFELQEMEDTEGEEQDDSKEDELMEDA